MKTLRNRFLKFALLAFIATRALTPVGFMPNALASGLPFILCGGNAESVQILALLDHHHAHHNHSETQSRQFADNTCGFSLLSLPVGTSQSVEIVYDNPLFLAVIALDNSQVPDSILFRLPPSRAPPRLVV